MSLQATLVKTLLKLPDSWLVRMGGGKPLEIGGRVLEPKLQFIAHGASKQPPMSASSAQTARAGSDEALAMLKAPMEPGVTTEGFSLNAPGRDIPVRL